MTTFLIGAICGIVALLLCICIISIIEDRKTKKEIGGDYYNVVIPKSEKINRNVTICLSDDEYTNKDLDEDNNIIAFMDLRPNNIAWANFYYSLFVNKQVITIDYNLQMYKAVITQIKLIDENTLRIYYTVINKTEFL